VEDGSGQLNVAKMPRADLDIFFARRARVHAVDGTELRVIKTLFTWLLVVLVHGLRVDDMHYTHGLDLFGGEQPELDLLDGPERTFRYCWRAGRHIGGIGKFSWRGVAGDRVIDLDGRVKASSADSHTWLLVRVLRGV